VPQPQQVKNGRPRKNDPIISSFCGGSDCWSISFSLWKGNRMARMNKYVVEMNKLNQQFLKDEISFHTYKEKANSILLDTPDEDKVKVANAALFVSLSVH